MYLKRLELYGFKSFADKTRLEFEPGITAIIGPNGCGKSNISDAIRWCLGEQSVKSLRSHQMMDVVFAGSQSRQTTGMAEVSLTFDNSQNKLPIDYSEVTISRRLFRSGESEYFINKVQCRLKDIRDIFLDTGIGTEGYSIMEQGKVEFILSTKAEERRELFEEAAGVSKYKVRREETLRKLDKVEIDMNRVNDMLAMLKEQINALDAAARKARQYQKYQEDLKRLETASIIQQIINSKSEVEKIQNELNPHQIEFEKLNTAFDQADTEISQMRMLQMEKDEEYVKQQEELSQIRSGINLSDERVQQAGIREVELNERLDTLHKEIEEDTQKITDNKKELENIKALCEELKSQVVKLEEEYKAKELVANDIRSKINEQHRIENNLKTETVELVTQKTNFHNEQNRLLSLEARCQSQILSFQKELTRLEENCIPLKESITQKEQELTELKDSNQQIFSHIQVMQNKINELESEHTTNLDTLGKTKEKIISLESRIQTLKEWEQQDPQRAAIKQALNLDFPGIKGPISSLIQMNYGYDDIVANALGEKLNYLIADTVDNAKNAIKYMEDNNLGRVTFIIEEKLPDASFYSSVAQPAAAMTLLSMFKYESEYERTMKFLASDIYVEGNTLFGQAIIQGGNLIKLDKPVLVEEQIRQYAIEIDSLKQEIVTIENNANQTQQSLDECLEHKKNLDMEHNKNNLNLEWKTTQLQEQKDEYSLIEKELTLNKNDIQSKEQEEQDIKDQLSGLTDAISNISLKEQEIKVALEDSIKQISSLRNEENNMLPLVTEAKVAWATQANEFSSRERELEKLQETVTSLEENISYSTNEISETTTKISEQKRIQETESNNLKELHVKQEEKEKEVQISLNERQSMMQEMEQKNTVLHELRRQTEEQKMKIHHLEMQLNSHDLQMKNLENRLTHDFSLSFEEVKDEYVNIEVQEEEIQRLKRRIESMGSVNLAAPEEYSNIEERYNFLLTQQQDLLKAREDLHKVITTINQNTLENFKKTFEQVRENFRNIYRQLFEGGEADLILTDESNLLETGVDIVAQPPGKKLQNIVLLSGGEKALTAIALLFSFFMVKPSPFCILDEVDAPLDDANIGRFIGMIKSFASQSQFLTITHNKRTMEMADVLYGVTMEQLGVSKIISVKLNREELAVSA